MRAYVLAFTSFVVVVVLAAIMSRATQGAIDPTTFIAANALWWGCRAYYERSEVSTAHKISGDE